MVRGGIDLHLAASGRTQLHTRLADKIMKAYTFPQVRHI